MSEPTCWRSECRAGCYYADVCSEKPPTPRQPKPEPTESESA